MGKRGPSRNSMELPITAERRKVFLDTLARTGVWSAACRASSPHSPADTANPPCSSSFRALMRRDIEFATAVESAMQQAKDAVLLEIHRRGQEGWLEPVYQKGARVVDIGEDGKPVPASIRKFSDHLLLARARAMMPELFSEKHDHTHTVNITAGRQGYWTIAETDLVALSDAEKDQLLAIMSKVRDHRTDVRRIEHQPAPAGEVVDAEFEQAGDYAEFDLGEGGLADDA